MNTIIKSDIAKNADSTHIIINGDNLKVLPDLCEIFAKKVSCIYIDPPYNNGEDYSFYADTFSREEWISKMRQVLLNLRPFLKEDGSIWISIDDGMVHHLRILCDDVFGAPSFVATIVWQQRNTRENRKAFSNNHEYLLVYSPNPNAFKKKRNLLPITNALLTRYKNPDNDPRGPWQSVSANVQDGHAVPSQFYEVVAPNGKKHSPPKGRCWIYNKDRMEREIKEGNIWFGSDGNGVPRVKKFISDSKKGIVPETLWLSSFAGTNKDAKTHLQQLKIYDSSLFDTPKPEQLIKAVLDIATSEGDLVLDAFLGSGTTTAVAHKMGRNYVGIELSKRTCNYVVQRMNKVVEGEKGGISKTVSWAGGGDYMFIEEW